MNIKLLIKLQCDVLARDYNGWDDYYVISTIMRSIVAYKVKPFHQL